MLDSEKFVRVFSAKILRAKNYYASSVFQKDKLRVESSRMEQHYKYMLGELALSKQQEESLRQQCEAVRRQREEQELRCQRSSEEIANLKCLPYKEPQAQTQARERHR